MKTTFLIIAISILTSCASSNNIKNSETNNNQEEIVISELSSSSQILLDQSDIAKFFCNNLTDYFNNYKYYKISTEVFHEKEKQTNNTTAKVAQKKNLYYVEYRGVAGRYIIIFSKKMFQDSEEILTFTSRTIIGNSIRSKVYDTFTAWINKEEIALKANYNSYLYRQELSSAVEIENWFNRLSASDKTD